MVVNGYGLMVSNQLALTPGTIWGWVAKNWGSGGGIRIRRVVFIETLSCRKVTAFLLFPPSDIHYHTQFDFTYQHLTIKPTLVWWTIV